MATFQEQLTKANKLTPNKIEADLFKFIRKIENVFIELNKSQLREDSQDIFGKPIGFYSLATDLISGGKKKQGDPFTGEDSGDWFAGFYIQIVSGVVRFSSRDPKNSLILGSDNWLSDDLFGLTDKNLRAVIRKDILPFFLKHIRDTLEI